MSQRDNTLPWRPGFPLVFTISVNETNIELVTQSKIGGSFIIIILSSLCLSFSKSYLTTSKISELLYTSFHFYHFQTRSAISHYLTWKPPKQPKWRIQVYLWHRLESIYLFPNSSSHQLCMLNMYSFLYAKSTYKYTHTHMHIYANIHICIQTYTPYKRNLQTVFYSGCTILYCH